MVALYSIAVIAGALALLAWVALAALAERPEATVVAPAVRFGETGQALVAGTLGFGLGGMSGSYAGWSGLAAAAAAIGGGALLAVSARWLGGAEDS